MATLANSPAQAVPLSAWVGRALTGLFALFMLGASIAPKFIGFAGADQMMISLGWSPDYILMIGGFELGFLLLYLYPRTSVRGGLWLRSPKLRALMPIASTKD